MQCRTSNRATRTSPGVHYGDLDNENTVDREHNRREPTRTYREQQQRNADVKSRHKPSSGSPFDVLRRRFRRNGSPISANKPPAPSPPPQKQQQQHVSGEVFRRPAVRSPQPPAYSGQHTRYADSSSTSSDSGFPAEQQQHPPPPPPLKYAARAQSPISDSPYHQQVFLITYNL